MITIEVITPEPLIVAVPVAAVTTPPEPAVPRFTAKLEGPV